VASRLAVFAVVIGIGRLAASLDVAAAPLLATGLRNLEKGSDLLWVLLLITCGYSRSEVVFALVNEF
jgi:hypothetical protein